MQHSTLGVGCSTCVVRSIGSIGGHGSKGRDGGGEGEVMPRYMLQLRDTASLPSPSHPTPLRTASPLPHPSLS
jgi:hypothetical protein